MNGIRSVDKISLLLMLSVFCLSLVVTNREKMKKILYFLYIYVAFRRLITKFLHSLEGSQCAIDILERLSSDIYVYVIVRNSNDISKYTFISFQTVISEPYVIVRNSFRELKSSYDQLIWLRFEEM